jgi:hypothetical protein
MMAAFEYNGRQAGEQLSGALQDLWTSISASASLIQSLRKSNSALIQRIEELEGAVHTLKEDLNSRDKKIQDIEEKKLMNVDVGDRLLYLTPDEREAMEHQIDELLALLKIHVG